MREVRYCEVAHFHVFITWSNILTLNSTFGHYVGEV